MKLLIAFTFLIAIPSLEAADSWPQFRGPNAAGVADEERPPVQFGPEKNLQWKIEVPPGISSPVIDAESGDRLVDRKRLGIPGQAVASPIAANGYIYIVSEPGVFSVLRAGNAIDVAAINELGESVRCTPAIANDTLYVRSAGHLWAFQESQPAQP